MYICTAKDMLLCYCTLSSFASPCTGEILYTTQAANQVCTLHFVKLVHCQQTVHHQFKHADQAARHVATRRSCAQPSILSAMHLKSWASSNQEQVCKLAQLCHQAYDCSCIAGDRCSIVQADLNATIQQQQTCTSCET